MLELLRPILGGACVFVAGACWLLLLVGAAGATTFAAAMAFTGMAVVLLRRR